MVFGIISITLWVATIVGYVIYNLLRKNEQLEKMVIERDSLLAELKMVIEESDRAIQEVDKLGAFRSDDEIGFFFQTVKAIQQALNQFANRK